MEVIDRRSSLLLDKSKHRQLTLFALPSHRSIWEIWEQNSGDSLDRPSLRVLNRLQTRRDDLAFPALTGTIARER